jgi:hypothetical protein
MSLPIENKAIVFLGEDSTRSKIFINDIIRDRANALNCLGYIVSYEGEKDNRKYQKLYKQLQH